MSQIDEAELKVILARIRKNIETGLLARNPEFLRALEWEVDDRDLDGICQGPPPDSEKGTTE